MSRNLFVSRDGRNIVRIRDHHFGESDIGLISFPDLTNQSPAIAVTDLSDKMNPRYQVIDTLGDRTLINTFGRSMDTRTISGICYEGLCETGSARSGYEDLMSFFNRVNAVVRNTPIIITVGRSFARQCYLLEMRIRLADPIARIWQFDSQLIVQPEAIFGFANFFANTGFDTTSSSTPSSASSNTTPSPTLNQSNAGLLSASGDQVTPATASSPSTIGPRSAINPFVV